MRRLLGLLVIFVLVVSVLTLPWLVPLAMRGSSKISTTPSTNRMTRPMIWEPDSIDYMIQDLVTVNRAGDLAWSSYNGMVHVARIEALVARKTIQTDGKLQQMALDDTGLLLATINTDGRVEHWDQEGSRKEVPLHTSEWANSIAFDDRSHLWIVSVKGNVYVYNFDQLVHLVQISELGQCLKIESFHSITVISGGSGKIYVFQYQDLVQTLDGVDFALDPKCRYMVIKSNDNTLTLWVRTGSFQPTEGHVSVKPDEELCGISNRGLVTTRGWYPILDSTIHPSPQRIAKLEKSKVFIHGSNIIAIDPHAGNFGSVSVFAL